MAWINGEPGGRRYDRGGRFPRPTLCFAVDSPTKFGNVHPIAEKPLTFRELLRGQRLRYGAAIGAILLGSCLLYLRPLVARGVIDFVVTGKPLEAPEWVRDAVAELGGRSTLAQNLWIAGLAIVLITTAGGVFGYFRGAWSAKAAEAIARRLRDRLYEHLGELPCRYHDTAETGDLVQRCTSDVETIRLFLATQVVEVGRGAILLGTALPILLWLDWSMGLLSMAILPVLVGFSLVFFLKVKTTFKQMDEAEGAMTARLSENLSGSRAVRAFARQDFERRAFATHCSTYRDRWYGVIKVLSWFWPVSGLLCNAQIGLVLVVGGYRVWRGDMTAGTLYAFLACANMFLWPIRQLGRVLSDLGKATVSMARVGEVLAQPVEADLPATAGNVTPRITGDIAVKGLRFGHAEGANVLTDVSFDVQAGQTLAILGPSGSGKSTLINLLLRLYDYQSGSICVDGVELSALPRKYVRGQIGAVLQEPFLYSRSLRENVKLGRTAADDTEMIAATSAAAVHDSIAAFADGYDTLVGERGVTLSGGQRQRVAIARALLKDPPILILDDALSAVDTQTESMILRALRDRHGRRTTLVIAHRVSTLMHADRIIVLERGTVTQSGTHNQLLAADGLYRKLWRIQTALADEIAEDQQQSGGG